MAENRCSCGQGNASNSFLNGNNTICIDTYRVLDSCRDKDCYEDVRVFLTENGQCIIDRTTNIRTVCTEIVCANVTVDPVQFNRGFYQINTKIYIKIVFEACINGKSQTFDGMSVIEKKVVLYGGEGNANIFKSTSDSSYCAECVYTQRSSNVPVGVVETVSPIALSVKVAEPNNCNGYCCCCCSDIPEAIADTIDGGLIDSEGNRLYVSLGIFSIVRIERPAQYLVNATDYCVPDKECVTAESDNPCCIFKNMAFPTNEFCARSLSDGERNNGSRH